MHRNNQFYNETSHSAQHLRETVRLGSILLTTRVRYENNARDGMKGTWRGIRGYLNRMVRKRWKKDAAM